MRSKVLRMESHQFQWLLMYIWLWKCYFKKDSIFKLIKLKHNQESPDGTAIPFIFSLCKSILFLMIN